MDLVLRLENFTGKNIKEDAELYTALRKVWMEKGFNERELNEGNIEDILFKLKGDADLKNSSYVPTPLVKQLLKEYSEHLENGLKEDEALEKVFQENKIRISKSEIKRFVLRQKEIYEKLIKILPGESKTVVNNVAIEQLVLEQVVGKETAEKIIIRQEHIRERSKEINVQVKMEIKAKELTNKFMSNVDLPEKSEKVKKEVHEIIKKYLSNEGEMEQVKILLQDYLHNNLGPVEKSQLETQIRITKVEGEQWIKENNEELVVIKQKELREKIEDKIFKENKELILEEVEAVKEYSKMVSKIYYPERGGIAKHESETKEKAKKDGVNKDASDEVWADVSVLSTVVKMQSSQFGDFLDKFKSVKNKIGRVKLPTELIEVRSVERIVELIQLNEEIKNLVVLNQRFINVYDKMEDFVGEKLQSWGMKKIGGSIMDRMGVQSTNKFVSESFSIIAKKGTKEGIIEILKGIVSGGAKAASTGAVTTAEAGGVAASQAIPVVGQIILAAAVVWGAAKGIYNKFVKPIVSGIREMFEKLGIDVGGLSLNTKKFFQEHLGKFFGSVIDIGIKSAIVLVAIPTALLAAPLTFLAGPVVMFFIIGFMAYSTLTSNLISSLVPPLNMSGGGSSTELINVTPPVANLPESCPSGWPSSQGCITQGPQTTGTHPGLEAVDIGCLSYGDPIYTTHDGVAVPLWTAGCGYGMDVYGTCNGVKFYTHFCHFPYQILNGTTEVKKGDKIGVVDDTGYSFGNHIHYDLKGLGGISSYLPHAVPAGCLNFAACGSLYIN